MSRRAQLLVAAGIAAFGLLVLLATAFAGPRSVRDHIAASYAKTATTDPALKGSTVYRSADAPSKVVEDITSAWKPADRHAEPAGFFLRYRNDMVVVSPDGDGSRIVVDEARRGYSRWYPYVGGYWGTYTGGGDDIRGGGPGAGK